MAKKLEKTIEDTNVKISVLGGEKGEMVFDFNALPEDIRKTLGPFGLNHKLGDSAAGKEGTDAEDAINRVFEGLMAGDWSVRAPAAPKVSVKELAANYANLDDRSERSREGSSGSARTQGAWGYGVILFTFCHSRLHQGRVGIKPYPVHTSKRGVSHGRRLCTLVSTIYQHE